MKSLTQCLADFRRARAGMEELNKNLPRIIGVESVRIVKQNFKTQGYDSGSGVTKWESRKDSTNRAYDAGRSKGKQGRYKGSVYHSYNPLLLQSKNLFNAVKYKAIVKSVFIGVDSTLVPYAERQNKGGGGIPARQFMPYPNQGPNVKMLRIIGKQIINLRNKAMKEFKK